MQDTLLETIEKTIRRCGLLAGGEKVLAAVSGGADSVCLLDVFYKLRAKLGISLCVGHVNHLLRQEAAEDARYVEDLARNMGLEVEVAVVEVAALAKEKKLSLEDAARQARYQALEAMAARRGADCIAVAHTADDQVETILLNFLRGGGPEGLAGMPISRDFLSTRQGKIIRPLLDITKAEAEDYCRRYNLAVRLDATNLELAALRNRIRHKLLPLLKAEQPALNKVLLRQAEIFREENAFLRELAEQALESVLVEANHEASSICLSIPKLLDLPIVLGRRVVREALRSLRSGRQPLGLEQVDRVLDLARTGETGKRLELGEGLCAEREYEKLILVRSQESGVVCQEEKSLPIPGEVEFEGCRIRAERVAREQVPNLQDDAGGRMAYLDATKLVVNQGDFEALQAGWGRASVKPAGGVHASNSSASRVTPRDETPPPPVDYQNLCGGLPGQLESLIVRPPRRGDKFVPLGSDGHMKLHDFFINLKVTRAQRAKALVVCLGDTIVWVAGYRIDDRFKVTEGTREVVKLHIS
jgi:tRNA(Ile)-lysidine synthase